MTLKAHNPKSIAAPGGAFVHGMEIMPGARILHVSGQIAVKPDGSTPEGFEPQAEVVWQNITAILAEAGMSASDIVKMNAYLTSQDQFGPYVSVRNKYLGGHKPASTSVVVAALASPKWLIEVEVVAAKA